MNFPQFDGRVYLRDESEDYMLAANQYATTSVNDDKSVMSPYFIIEAKNQSDVIKAIQYAQDNEIAIAVRTGGHQYCGMSSTSGNNIQLDVSRTFTDVDLSRLHDDGIITTGISLSLHELDVLLLKNKIFVPHGECDDVHLGGHMQTGGYGLMTRSFGLLGDHVISFHIIMAGYKKGDMPIIRLVSRELYPDLFEAVTWRKSRQFWCCDTCITKSL